MFLSASSKFSVSGHMSSWIAPRESRRPGAASNRLKTERAIRPFPHASFSMSFQEPSAVRFHTSNGPYKKTQRRHEGGISCSKYTAFILLVRNVGKRSEVPINPCEPSDRYLCPFQSSNFQYHDCLF